MSLFGKQEMDLRSWWQSVRESAEIILVCITGILLALVLLRVAFPSIDTAWSLVVYNAGVSNSALDDFTGYIASIGYFVWVPLIFWMYVFRKTKHGWHSAIILAIAIVSAMALVELLKVGFNLPRPYEPLNAPVVPQITPKFETPSPINAGFPSGHTTTAFATATVILGRYRNWGYLFLGIAIGTGISMVHLGLHFPSDVIAGAFLGALCGTFALGLAKYREGF
jgi:undecaprenyl-diphosphatase